MSEIKENLCFPLEMVIFLLRADDNIAAHHVDTLCLFEASPGRSSVQHLDVTPSYRLSIFIPRAVTLPFYYFAPTFILLLILL